MSSSSYWVVADRIVRLLSVLDFKDDHYEQSQ